MVMNGEYMENLNDLKRCFSLEELLYSYYNGELEIFLDKIGEQEKAEQIRNISEKTHRKKVCKNAVNYGKI